MGLVNRVVPAGQSLDAAIELAREISRFPQTCMNNDRLSAYEQFGMSLDDALANEFERGTDSLAAGAVEGAKKFADGAGRHGEFE
jgi:enoyl-CoA hydratase